MMHHAGADDVRERFVGQGHRLRVLDRKRGANAEQLRAPPREIETALAEVGGGESRETAAAELLEPEADAATEIENRRVRLAHRVKARVHPPARLAQHAAGVAVEELTRTRLADRLR